MGKPACLLLFAAKQIHLFHRSWRRSRCLDFAGRLLKNELKVHSLTVAVRKTPVIWRYPRDRRASPKGSSVFQDVLSIFPQCV